MTDLDQILIAAHRGNIDRYRRLLRTDLTDLERDFIDRRLSEERSALNRLLARQRSPAQPAASPSRIRGLMIAADVLARRRAGTMHSG